MNSFGHPKRQQMGFTLVEVTVALVLTSMLAALLTSALYFAGRTRVAVSSDMQEQIRRQINANRFEQILSHCIPGVARGELVFRGTETSVECLSMQSLTTSNLRMPVKVSWKIAETDGGQSSLLYSDEGLTAGGDMTVAKFTGKGQFVYWGADGKPSSRWPLPTDKEQWLPRMVEIRFVDSEQPNGRWAVSLRMTPQPELMPPSLFGTDLR